MVDGIKEPFDVYINHPRVTPAIYAGLLNGLVRTLIWPITKGVWREVFIYLLFQLSGYYHLCHPVFYRRYPQRSDTSITLWYFHTLHSGWKITSTGKAAPHRVKMFPRISRNL